MEKLESTIGGENGQRMKDLDTAREMAETEQPIRNQIRRLAEMGVPKEEIEKAFDHELDYQSERARIIYTKVKELADALLIAAMKNPSSSSRNFIRASEMAGSLSLSDAENNLKYFILEKARSILQQQILVSPDKDNEYSFYIAEEKHPGDFSVCCVVKREI